jgi:hypothetical protein
VPGAQAQQGAGEPSAAITGEQANTIIQELKEIRKLLESIDKKGVAQQAPRRPPVPQTAKVSIKDAATLGSADLGEDPDCDPIPEICDDGIDNSGNGLVDCADPACDGFVGGACDTGNLGICAAGTTACREL